jgi:hypothetical protein
MLAAIELINKECGTETWEKKRWNIKTQEGRIILLLQALIGIVGTGNHSNLLKS